MTIAVGLSGGVDSSVTAWLLKQEGHRVIGATMQLVPEQENTTVADARKVAEFLDIPHHVINLEKAYHETIINYIGEEYARGRTPNPCVCCNRAIKFGLFLDRIEQLAGPVDKMATGHFADIVRAEPSGRLSVRQGSHREKDQAYFLSLLSQKQLERIIFPLADKSKPEVRELAREAGLFTSDKTESQDLCVGEYRKWINTGGPGDFVTAEGKKIGRHQGIGNYTIGQRKGLGVSSTEPLFVTRLDTASNRVFLSPREEDLLSDRMIIGAINWMGIEEPEPPAIFEKIKIRYADSGEKGVLQERLSDGRWLVRFENKRRAITPGQLAVFYNSDRVELAGIIESVSKIDPEFA
jgi:tRNA-specific 2-thiouridylase